MKPYNFFRILALILFFIPSFAHAGSLTIQGTSTISVSQSEAGFKLTGHYTISNSGDESAGQVFPTLENGTWLWKGEPRRIDPGKKEVWKIDTAISREELRCSSDCAGLDLPTRGSIPFKAVIFYQDMAGYQFSAADVVRLPFELEGPQEETQNQVPSVDPLMKAEGNGQKFEVFLSGRVHKPDITELAVSFFSSRELSIAKPSQRVPVIDGQFEASSLVSNFKGLDNSSYAVVALIQWQEGSMRGSNRAFTSLRIEQVDKSNYFLWGGIGLFILSSLVVYLVAFRG